jgi:hypothetical protein
MPVWVLFAFITKELSSIGQFLMSVNIVALTIGSQTKIMVLLKMTNDFD